MIDSRNTGERDLAVTHIREHYGQKSQAAVFFINYDVKWCINHIIKYYSHCSHCEMHMLLVATTILWIFSTYINGYLCKATFAL